MSIVRVELSAAAALWCAVVIVLIGAPTLSDAQLDPLFYQKTCPNLRLIVRTVILKAANTDPRIFASLIRLHFHDCFVQGCDASILLNNSPTIVSEQQARPNNNSIRGLDVVNQIKTEVEKACPNTVSCADILALAAGISSVWANGTRAWPIPVGRRDSLTANRSLANQNLPGPSFNLSSLTQSFALQGLNIMDLVALSGAHSIGKGQCQFIADRLYNFKNTGKPDPTLNGTYLLTLRSACPQGGLATKLVNLDPTTPNRLDNKFYSNLRDRKGFFRSDQVLFSTPGAATIAILNNFSKNQTLFIERFKNSLIKMGNIGVLTGSEGEIRKHCNFVNAKSGLATVGTQESAEYDMASSI